MATIGNTAIDQNARSKFEAELTGYAGISAIKTIYRADSLAAHRQGFRDGKRGVRDACRAQVHLEAAALKNAEARVLEFYLALNRAGYAGSCAPEEVIAYQVIQATGGLCAPRTYRAALAGLCRRGWLDKRLIPTGTRIVVGETSEGLPIWRSLRVNKVSLTRAAKLLVAKAPPSDWFSRGSSAGAPASGGQVKTSPTGGPAHIGIPRQKGPPTEGGNHRDRGTLRRPPCPEWSNVDLEYDTSRETPAGPIEGMKGSPAGDVLTCPPDAGAPATCKHQPYTQTATAKPSRKSRKKGGSRVGYRQAGNATPKTWERARSLFLDDLYSAHHDDPSIDTLYRIASVQTDRDYPPACVTVLNWDSLVWKWLELPWGARRRILARQVVPPLRAFVRHLIPPSPKSSPDEMLAYQRLRDFMRAMPAALPAGTTPQTAQLIRSQRFALDTVPLMLADGRLAPKDIDPQVRAAFAALESLTEKGDA